MQTRQAPSRNVYLELTGAFNDGRLRAIVCGGQAVVLHKLAVMSKDGDWILREDAEALSHVLKTLEARGARYRFGAPLDERWLAGSWSAHLEFQDSFRVRTDFFTRPPRVSPSALERIWKEQERRPVPFLDPRDLAEMKKTNREKDYVVIGELGRLMQSPLDRLLHSRSARDILAIASAHPEALEAAAPKRPLLREVEKGEDAIARLLDEERRDLIKRNERRLTRFSEASTEWVARWPQLSRLLETLPLREAHAAMVEAALGVLPFRVEGVSDD